MKRLTMLLIAVFATTVIYAQSISFGQLNYNFGELTYRGEAKTAGFTFTNSGNKPLVILRTKVNCSCITVTFPRKPVPAGSSGEIAIIYNPTKDTGDFFKSVEIYTNAPNQERVILVVEGTVVRKRR
jgi:hypothetical protein